MSSGNNLDFQLFQGEQIDWLGLLHALAPQAFVAPPALAEAPALDPVMLFEDAGANAVLTFQADWLEQLLTLAVAPYAPLAGESPQPAGSADASGLAATAPGEAPAADVAAAHAADPSPVAETGSGDPLPTATADQAMAFLQAHLPGLAEKVHDAVAFAFPNMQVFSHAPSFPLEVAVDAAGASAPIALTPPSEFPG